MSDNRQSLSDLANLTSQPAPVAATSTVLAGDEYAPAAPVVVREPMPLREQILDKQGRAYATGRRKDAVARVWVKPGTGKITVNGRDFSTYFARPVLQMVVQQPVVAAARQGQFDVVSETDDLVPGDAWSDFLPESKKLKADWVELKCGNYDTEAGKCLGETTAAAQ